MGGGVGAVDGLDDEQLPLEADAGVRLITSRTGGLDDDLLGLHGIGLPFSSLD